MPNGGACRLTATGAELKLGQELKVERTIVSAPETPELHDELPFQILGCSTVPLISLFYLSNKFLFSLSYKGLVSVFCNLNKSN